MERYQVRCAGCDQAKQGSKQARVDARTRTTHTQRQAGRRGRAETASAVGSLISGAEGSYFAFFMN